MTAAALIPVAIVNPATGDASIDVGVTATLKVTLTNKTGGAIGISATNPASTLTIYGDPATLFTAAQFTAMAATLDGWTPSVDSGSPALVLTANKDQRWDDGADLVLTLDGVVSTDAPGADGLQINPVGLTGNVPFSTSGTLILKEPKKPGNASLTDVLQVNLDNQGLVYRSDEGDPLTNVLFLNIKNTAAAAVYRGKTAAGSPRVDVRFVYGGTAGALAPATNNGGVGPIGSAWNIRADPKVVPLGWSTTNPDIAASDPVPVWTLTPSTMSILGTGDLANVTFTFSDIISFTPVGHTQMYLLFTGFMQDETTRYDDHVFVLDIPKVDPPPTRGLVAFNAGSPLAEMRDPNAAIPISLRWTMFDVARVQLLASAPTVPPAIVSYPDPKPLDYDSLNLSVPPVARSEPIFFSLQSFDGNEGFLNALQFTVYVQVSWVSDPTGRTYPVGLFGNTFWMLQNYAYDTHGSFAYGTQKLTDAYGRLYNWDAANANAPDGWQLPGVADWQALFNLWPSSTAAFAELIDGGNSGFAAGLGGQQDNTGTLSGLLSRGVYWTASNPQTAQFSTGSGTGMVSVSTPLPDYAVSTRYIRHV
ncbi:FISUMP domain-containing protein [Mesorhizobium sp. IMUNJ 23232]|uniref:FISUMP domain-containing protein n=1 Tax=Mesorhizobium sp. IMUNJ 23232 TaxID=3376064 RepID=UPI003790CCB7